jgi:pimeloyl-ACP methyl ester carboxylesterase
MKKDFEQENVTQYCAPNARNKLEFISLSDGVALRLITFHPTRKTGNPTVLFIPGWITRMAAWKDVLPELTSDFAVYYLETREKISSLVSGKADYSVQAIGQDIADFVAKKRLDNYVLLGSSLGATAIIECFAHLCTKPEALVLINPNAEFRVPKSWVLLIRLFYPPLYSLIRPAVKWYLRTFRMDLESDLAQYEKYCRALDAADPWKLKKAVLSLRTYSVWDRLEAIDVPVLFIGASKDSLHEPESVGRMSQLVRNGRLLDMETNSATHSKLMVEKVRMFLKEIAGFDCLEIKQ